RSAATAGMLAVVLKIVSVVEGQFFPGGNIAPGDDPDLPFDILGVAVGSATVVDKAGRVPAHAAIDVPFVVQFKNERVAGFTSASGFGVGYLRGDILDQQQAGANRCRSERPEPLNGRRSEFQDRLGFLSHSVWRQIHGDAVSSIWPRTWRLR